MKTGTNGKIDKIIDDIAPTTIMYLINAIYFKGAWRDGFDSKRTASGMFTTHTGQQVSARFMTRKGGFRAGMVGNTQVVELPYGGDAYVMTIALPAEGTPINALVAGLSPAYWQSLTGSIPSASSSFELHLPKFTLSWEDTLNDELKTLGMRKAFMPGVADFSRLSRSQAIHLYISEVKQKTFVDVNEEGTEAAAVTSVAIDVVSLPPSIRLDRPFVFAIRERLTGTVVFLGKIVRPTSA